MRSNIAKQFEQNIPVNTKIFIEQSSDLTVLINQILNDKNMTQKDLADKLGKKTSEINKWLSGTHNFTLQTLANLSQVLGEQILIIPVHAPKPNQEFSDKSSNL